MLPTPCLLLSGLRHEPALHPAHPGWVALCRPRVWLANVAASKSSMTVPGWIALGRTSSQRRADLVDEVKPVLVVPLLADLEEAALLDQQTRGGVVSGPMVA